VANNTINQINSSVDQTVQIFDRFYSYQAGVNAIEYDVVYSYFASVFNTAQQAKNFTTTLFRVAEWSDIPPLTLLEQFKGQSTPQITVTFAYYLNTLQSPATMLGISLPSSPNYYVAHNIRQ
jgi:pyruvate/2-oxoacid:ferredoxin oxidoreductase alpha subunit